MIVNHGANIWLVDDPNEIIRCRSPQQQPFLRVRLESGELVAMTFQLAELLGEEGKIWRERVALKESPSIPARKNKPRVRQ